MTIEQFGLESFTNNRADELSRNIQNPAHKLHEVASEFESLFVKQLLQSMRSTLNPENNFLYGGFAEEVFQDMMDTEYSQILAKAESFGFAEMIIQQYEANTVYTR